MGCNIIPAESQADGSFPADGDKAVLNKANKTSRTINNSDNKLQQKQRPGTVSNNVNPNSDGIRIRLCQTTFFVRN